MKVKNKTIKDLQLNTNHIHHQWQDAEHKLEAANKQIADLNHSITEKKSNKILLSKIDEVQSSAGLSNAEAESKINELSHMLE